MSIHRSVHIPSDINTVTLGEELRKLADDLIERYKDRHYCVFEIETVWVSHHQVGDLLSGPMTQFREFLEKVEYGFAWLGIAIGDESVTINSVDASVDMNPDPLYGPTPYLQVENAVTEIYYWDGMEIVVLTSDEEVAGWLERAF